MEKKKLNTKKNEEKEILNDLSESILPAKKKVGWSLRQPLSHLYECS